MQIKEIVDHLEQWAPLSLQEPYDNSGLLVGNKSDETKGVLITLDVTEEVIEEAIETGTDLIIAHHPLIFSDIKRIGNQHWVERCLRKSIKYDIAIYAIHTNLDNIRSGVNKKISDKIGLENPCILQPKPSTLAKLKVFVPSEHKGAVLDALYGAGAGKIGNYDRCSFYFEGTGTFRGNEASNPTIGTQGEDKSIGETCVEVIVPKHNVGKILDAMKNAHPYEEVAYYLQDLINYHQEIGAGMIGNLKVPMKTEVFMSYLKQQMNLSIIRHTRPIKKMIRTIAICGGSGHSLLSRAIISKADIFITADFKYHDFFEANGNIIIADIGHYESEVFTKELLQNALTKKFPKFAFRLSQVNTNPITYL